MTMGPEFMGLHSVAPLFDCRANKENGVALVVDALPIKA